jgi:lipopolysaccharide/colanic/teichoic acid biosynthesis glycosyltransferase
MSLLDLGADFFSPLQAESDRGTSSDCPRPQVSEDASNPRAKFSYREISTMALAGAEGRGTRRVEFAREIRARLRKRVRVLRIKRVFDLVGATAGLVLTFPILFVIALAILMDSRGPVVFTQLRHGRGGRPFAIYKFRTMYSDLSDLAGLVQAVRNDPRVTPVGRILRRTNLDELPQLWNVFLGDMSLIGPRPHPIGMKAGSRVYKELVPTYEYRHFVRPGITGLAQARGFRGPTVDEVAARMRIVCDLAYIYDYSFFWDLKIFMQTLIDWLVRRRLSGG